MSLGESACQRTPVLKKREQGFFDKLENILLLSYKISKTIECSFGQMKTPRGASSGGFHYSLLVLGSYSISIHIIRTEGAAPIWLLKH